MSDNRGKEGVSELYKDKIKEQEGKSELKKEE